MSDPLSPVSLAAVPEVRQALDLFENSARQARDFQLAANILPVNRDALLLAVRDATLKAERDRLLALTPEGVRLQAHADAVAEFCKGGPVEGDPVRRSVEMLNRLYRALEAALPLLLAPEVAKREQVEAGQVAMKAAFDLWFDRAQAFEREVLGWSGRATTAEAEVARLRGERDREANTCRECGDGRPGWTVQPRLPDGEAEQVQCRTCDERYTSAESSLASLRASHAEVIRVVREWQEANEARWKIWEIQPPPHYHTTMRLADAEKALASFALDGGNG